MNLSFFDEPQALVLVFPIRAHWIGFVDRKSVKDFKCQHQITLMVEEYQYPHRGDLTRLSVDFELKTFLSCYEMYVAKTMRNVKAKNSLRKYFSLF